MEELDKLLKNAEELNKFLETAKLRVSEIEKMIEEKKKEIEIKKREIERKKILEDLSPQPESPQPESPQPESPQPESPQPESPQPESSINKSKNKESCIECSKQFLLPTLTKNYGMCKRCYDKVRTKTECFKCKKSFSEKTLNKNSGICGRCAKPDFSVNGKLKIPKKIREESWKSSCGDTLEGECFSCEDTIYFNNFDCGHIVPEYSGGVITVSNLKPICKPCNTSCGVMNLYVFKELLEKGLVKIKKE